MCISAVNYDGLAATVWWLSHAYTFLLWLHLKRTVKLRKPDFKPLSPCLLHFSIVSSIYKIHCHDAARHCKYLETDFQKRKRESLPFFTERAFPVSFLDTPPLPAFSHPLRVRVAAHQRGGIKSSCCGVLLRAEKVLSFFFILSRCVSIKPGLAALLQRRR